LQAAIPEPAFQRPVLPPVPLPVHQHGEAFFEAEWCAPRIFLLLRKGVGLSSAIARFTSSKEKNLRLRKAATIQRWTT
jgi:hypothetical protein